MSKTWPRFVVPSLIGTIAFLLPVPPSTIWTQDLGTEHALRSHQLMQQMETDTPLFALNGLNLWSNEALGVRIELDRSSVILYR